MKGKGAIRFDKVEVHEFAPIIGSSPFVSSGVPVALGFRLTESRVMSVKQFERSRPPRKMGRELCIESETRCAMLKKEGYTAKEINEAILKSYKRRMAILESLNNKQWDKFNEKMESFTSPLTKFVRNRKHKEQHKFRQF